MASDVVVRFSQTAGDVSATIAGLDVLALGKRRRAAQSSGHRRRLGRDAEARGPARCRARYRSRRRPFPGSPMASLRTGPPGGPRSARTSNMSAVLYSRASMQGSRRLAGPDVCSRPSGQTRASSRRGRGFSCCWQGSWPRHGRYARLLPSLVAPPAGAGLGWRRLWMPLMVPMIATPILLRLLPTHFLPVLVADYLAAHFAVYGLITMACLAWMSPDREAQARRRPFPSAPSSGLRWESITYGFIALVWPINAFVTSFLPVLERAAPDPGHARRNAVLLFSRRVADPRPGAARGGYAVQSSRSSSR